MSAEGLNFRPAQDVETSKIDQQDGASDEAALMRSAESAWESEAPTSEPIADAERAVTPPNVSRREDASPLGGVLNEQAERRREEHIQGVSRSNLMEMDKRPLAGVKMEQSEEGMIARQNDYRERSEKSFEATGIKDPNYRWGGISEASETLPGMDDPRRKEVPTPKRGWISRLFNL